MPPISPSSSPVRRRHLLALGAAAAAAPALAAAPAQGAAPAPALTVTGGTRGRATGPVDRAYHYLDVVQDAYQPGGTPRLLQSYNNESGLFTTAFGYDNALATIAYLARPTREHIRRAKIIGDAFLWIQGNDERFTDGRLRQAYAAGPMVFYGGGPAFDGLVRTDGKAAFLWPFGFSGSSVGDLAWVGLALTQLYRRTRERRYLDGAVRIGTWITTNAVSPYRYGGYHGGVQADGTTPQRWASTEHNIDVYAFFRLLARHTRDGAWRRRAAVAGDFVRAMWHPAGGWFWTGTQGANPTDDPDAVNRSIIPEDVQTWAWLSLRERRYARAVDWVTTALATTDGGAGSELPSGLRISGVTFSDRSKQLTGPVPGTDRPNNRRAVWPEGNGHVAAALLDRGGRGDATLARHYLRQTVLVQDRLGAGQTVGPTGDPDGGRLSDPAAGGTWTGAALPARSGIVSATSAFDTGFGFGYFQRQHVGATSWFIMAALGVNPYR